MQLECYTCVSSMVEHQSRTMCVGTRSPNTWTLELHQTQFIYFLHFSTFAYCVTTESKFTFAFHFVFIRGFVSISFFCYYFLIELFSYYFSPFLLRRCRLLSLHWSSRVHVYSLFFFVDIWSGCVWLFASTNIVGCRWFFPFSLLLFYCLFLVYRFIISSSGAHKSTDKTDSQTKTSLERRNLFHWIGIFSSWTNKRFSSLNA